MKPEDIAKAYNTITHLWEDSDFDRTNGIAQHQKALAFAPDCGLALDVGCGCSGRLFDLLINAGFTPEGIDLSSEMVRLALAKHPSHTFHQKDICTWAPPKKYDFITAWDSIWHVPLHSQVKVITKLIDSLKTNGVLIFSAGGTDGESDHVDDFMGPEMYYSTLGVYGFMKLFMGLNCVCRHFEYDQYPALHCYFIVQKL